VKKKKEKKKTERETGKKVSAGSYARRVPRVFNPHEATEFPVLPNPSAHPSDRRGDTVALLLPSPFFAPVSARIR